MTIHDTDPFADPPEVRDPLRRLRGRLTGTVTVWTCVGDRDRRYGLSVTSMVVAAGDPGGVVALLDPDADLTEQLAPGGTAGGVAVVNVLPALRRDLAEAFGFVVPAPGGPFRLAQWTDSEWGPILDGAVAWAGVRVTEAVTPDGWWSTRVTATVERVTISEPDADVLVHGFGDYRPGRSG